MFALALFFAAVQDPTDVAAKVAVEVRDADLAETGAFTLRLTFEALEPIGAPYSIRLEVRDRGTMIVARDHAPKTPTKKWAKGKKVTYDVGVDFPLDIDFAALGPSLDVRLGFYNAETRATLPPRDVDAGMDGLAVVATMRTPTFTASADAAIERAKALAKEGRGPDAWNVLETALRLSNSDPAKRKLAAELVRVGAFAPAPISATEEGIVSQRIQAEKERYLRLVAGQMNDAGELHGAIKLLEILGGQVEEQAETAVIGAVDDAKRTQTDITQIEIKLRKQISPDDLKVAEAELKKNGPTDKLLKHAEAYAAQKKFPIALWLLNQICREASGELRDAADKRSLEVEEAYLKAIPPEQQAKIDAAVDHPVWARTATAHSHQFVFIGPKDLVGTIPRESMTRFDAAYVLLTDLFGRRPNPGGDRVTVYFKELWNFGGATGGGTEINVGRANPEAKGTRVDSNLMYHELTHCIDDTEPTYAGFHEGLAELGVAFALDGMGDEAASSAAIQRYLTAFRKDFVERDLDYWLIPEYAPSAGFFVHFIEKFGKGKDGYEWQRYRRFFREYREVLVRDGREPMIVRAIAFFLMKHFGDAAFDDLLTFRFPLGGADRDAIKREMEIYARGLRWLRRSEENDFDGVPLAPAPRDTLHHEFLELAKSGDEEEVRAFGRDKLGIIHTWLTIGPFQQRGADPDAFVFPPEYEFDIMKSYPGPHIAQWTRPDPTKSVHIDKTGWVDFAYTYRENCAFYALAHATVDKAISAVVHVRCDDDATLFVNDALIGKYRLRGDPGSTRASWRGPFARVPDGMRWAVTLKPGRNKIMLKVRNHGGNCGFILALTDDSGAPIAGLATDDKPPDLEERVDRKLRWSTVLECPVANATLAGALGDVMGGFALKDKRLIGTSGARNIPWRKYTVRPGFPTDSPSNLAWLKESLTKSLDDFDLGLAVDTAGGGLPKFCVTFQGEGENDPLSGWTLMLHPDDDGLVARVEHYDQIVYITAPTPVKTDAGPLAIRVRYEDSRLSVAVGETKLLDRAPLRPIAGKHRLGLTTWDPDTRIAGFVLRAGKPGK